MISMMISVSLITFAADNGGATIPTTETFVDLPIAMTSFGAAVQGDWLYVAGGHTGKAHEYSKDDFHKGVSRIRLDGGTTWEKLPGDFLLQSVALVTDGERLYRIGGMTARNEKGKPDDLHSTTEVAAYDPDTQTWTALPSLPVPRSSHDAVIDGRRIYVAGGWTLNGKDTEAEWLATPLMLDLDNAKEWKPLPDATVKRRANAVAVHNGDLWVIGGMDEYDIMLSEVEVLDLDKGTWREGPELPFKGFGVSAFDVGGRLYVNGMGSDVYVLSDDGQSWVAVGTLKTPRFFHRLIPGGRDRLLILGGVCHSGFLNSTEMLQLPKQTTQR